MGEPARKPDQDEDLRDPLEQGAEWEAEIDRRIEDVRSGHVKGIPHEEVMAKLRTKYGWT